MLINIRWAILRDLHEMIRIESESFDEPWSHDDFRAALRQRSVIGLVAEHDDDVVGYVIYELQKRSLRLLNLAVDPKWRRQGIGQQMIERLVLKFTRERRSLVLEVRETNLPAQHFFHHCGFRATSVLRNFYSGEDAYAMRYCVDSEMMSR